MTPHQCNIVSILFFHKTFESEEHKAASLGKKEYDAKHYANTQ